MIQKVRIIIDVEFNLNGIELVSLQSELDDRVERAVGNGLLAGDTAVEVDSWSSQVVAVSNAPSEDAIYAYFDGLVSDGNMSAEDLIRKVVRSGMQEVPDFIEEVRERMNFVDEESEEDETPEVIVNRITKEFLEGAHKIAIEFEKFLSDSRAAMDVANESISEMQDDAIDELKGALGSQASNHFESEEDQDEAISLAEEWVSKTVSSSLSLVLASIIWGKGFADGSKIINDAIADQ